MAKRNRSGRPRRADSIARPLKSTVVLAVPLVTGAAAVTVAVAELAPVAASASTTPSSPSSSGSGLLSNLLLPLKGQTTTAPKKASAPSSPGLLPNLNDLLPVKLPLLGSSPAPGSSTSPLSGLLGSSPAPHAKPKPQFAPPQALPKPTPMPWQSDATGAGGVAGSGAAAALTQMHPIGYALPVPESVVTAHPAIIGEGTAGPSKQQNAQAVNLPVPSGTPVNAVTAGTLKLIPESGGLSTIVLSGADGATYTYRHVAAQNTTAWASKVKAGQRIGSTVPGGLPFSIAVPDTTGLVDANEAMQAWAAGLTTNVRSLPSTVAPAAAPTKQQVTIVSDSGNQAVASSLDKSLAGPLIKVRNSTLNGTISPKSSLAKQISKSGNQLVIVAMSQGTPSQAAALASLLHGGGQMLWVAPPATTAQQASAYRALTVDHPGFRVESLPSALAVPTSSSALSALAAPTTTNGAHSASSEAARTAADQLAAGTLTANYATTAYRLYAISSQANTVLSWAELQLGKPYQWGAAGPDAFDCSGLTMDALNQAGIGATHNANAQYQLTSSHQVSKDQLTPGDLVFFSGSDGTASSPGHEGIYVGAGEIIDAPHTGAPVRFDNLSDIGGFTGATNPYAPAAGSGALSLAQLAGLAVPSALSQYQSFAQQLSGATWGPGQFTYLYQLWQRESGWNPAALNPLSGAFGIPQSLPAGKMASSGLDWQTDPYTQILWGIGYIQSAYGSPQAAWAHELSYGWY